jgi:plastocyanin
MGTVIGAICFIIGIPIFLFGALIFVGLSIAGIIGSSLMIPAIIFASALLLVGVFLMFAGWRNVHEKKIMTVNTEGQTPSQFKTPEKRRVNIARGLVIVVIVALVSVIAIGAAIIVPLLNDTDTSRATNTKDDETITTTTTTNAGTVISMKDSDFEPEYTRVPLNDDIVWVNHEDDPPHTATSGIGAENPNSGKMFNTGIIDGGDQSTPIHLKGLKVGDEIPYYCMVHSSMTGKLIVISVAARQNTTEAS